MNTDTDIENGKIEYKYIEKINKLSTSAWKDTSKYKNSSYNLVWSLKSVLALPTESIGTSNQTLYI